MNDNARTLSEALKSGKYKQTTGSLRVNDRFCCLGVACDLYRQATGKGRWRRESSGSDYWRFYTESDTHDDGESSILPMAVSEWLGMPTDDGSCDADHEESLVNLNDGGKTFVEIAEFMDSEPKGLFA